MVLWNPPSQKNIVTEKYIQFSPLLLPVSSLLLSTILSPKFKPVNLVLVKPTSGHDSLESLRVSCAMRSGKQITAPPISLLRTRYQSLGGGGEH